MKRHLLAIFCVAVALSASASSASAGRYRYYQYPADPYGAYTLPPAELAFACDDYARSYAWRAGGQGEILGGGAIGSLAGLGIGSLFAASGVGAAIGAAAGLLVGGGIRAQHEEPIYRAAFQSCMSQPRSFVVRWR